MTAPSGPPSGGGNAPTQPKPKKDHPVQAPKPPQPVKPDKPGNAQE
jgi:hypothetical protein